MHRARSPSASTTRKPSSAIREPRARRPRVKLGVAAGSGCELDVELSPHPSCADRCAALWRRRRPRRTALRSRPAPCAPRSRSRTTRPRRSRGSKALQARAASSSRAVADHRMRLDWARASGAPWPASRRHACRRLRCAGRRCAGDSSQRNARGLAACARRTPYRSRSQRVGLAGITHTTRHVILPLTAAVMLAPDDVEPLAAIC